MRFRSPALDLDGSDDDVNVGDVLDQTGPLAVEAWVYADVLSPATAARYLIAKTDGTTGWGVAQKSGANGVIQFITHDLSNVTLETPADAIALQTWHRISCVWDAATDTKTIYVDGVQKAQATTVTGDLTANAHSLRFGERSDGAANSNFDGRLDDARIWNTARTPTQVQQNTYKRLLGTESGLAGYWKFDENAGTQVKDSAGTNHGMITGAAWIEREVIANLSLAFKIDWDNDGTFSEIPNADILDLALNGGRDPAFGSVVAGSMTVVLDNRSGTYSLDQLSPISANLRPYRNFTLELLAGSTPFQFVTGKLLKLRVVEPDTGSIPTVTLEGRDLFMDMDAEARVDTLQSTTSKVLTETVLDQVGVTTAKRVIGVAGDAIPFAFGERRSARSWMDAVSLLGYRQFVDRQGRYTLLDRLATVDWMRDTIDSAHQVDIDVDDEGLTNRARVLIHPYKAHTTDHIVWSSGETPFTLAGNEERILLMTFRDPDSGIATGAISLVTPAATAARTGTLTSGSAIVTGLSHTSDLRKGQTVTGTGVPANTTIKTIDTDTQITLSANTTATGSQSLTFSPMDYAATNTDDTGDRTSDLTLTLVGNPSVSATLKVRNASVTPLKVTVLQQRGKLAVPQDIQALEQEITTDYPDLFRELDSDLLQTTSVAQTVLSYLLQRFSKPPRRYRATWTDADIWPSVVLEADINSAVLLNLPGGRLQPAMTILRGVSLRMQYPMILDATFDLDFVSLASGPSASVLDHPYDHATAF